MEFRALGPLEVDRNGEPLDLGPPKQRALLALLLINLNQPVTVDRIIDQLWEDEGEGSVNALRVHVSRLRSVLDPERSRGATSVLETRGSGYQLTIDPDQLDIVRFETLAAEGKALLESDPGAAAETLESALGLWTGSPFHDFAYDEFAQAERSRLSGLRLAALEDRIEADLSTGRSGELVSELEVLREEHPLRERLVGQQALALYRSGRPADALRAIDRFRCHVGDELGIDPSPQLLRLEERILLHDQSIQPRAGSSDNGERPRTEAANPFKGLRPFATADAAAFFGRDALIAELLRTVGSGQDLIALIGASGSGKSSVIRAGLIPALAKGAIEGSDRWLVANMMPGAHPFAELEAALLRSVLDPPDSLDEQLQDGETGLLRAALRVLPDEDSRLLLVIDQFEELFTMVDDEATRERFLSNIVTAVDDPHDRMTVLVTLRADFYSHPLQHPEFGARLGNGVVNVTPLSAEELEAAALKPAEEVGVSLEPALLGQLISDVGSQPGALPLFQYALTELFDRRSGDTLLTASYRSMGGVEGALQRTATDLMERLDPDQREATRQLFLRLVSVSEHDQRSRRRVTAREVASLTVETPTMHEVIKRFGDQRLLSFDSDPLTGAPTVEVAHEALLTAWPTLEEWIDESREDLRRHGALATALREWQLADRNPEYLLTSARLAEYEDWRRTSVMTLNHTELDFVELSAARVEELSAIEERRRQDESRSRRRLWSLVGALAGLLGVAALFLFGAFSGDPDQTVTFFGRSDDEGWNANIKSGLDRAARELDLDIVDVPWVIDPALDMRELAERDPEIVISDAFATSLDPTIVDDFPDTRFGVIEDVGRSAPNLTMIQFANEEGGFLAGVAAGLKSETGIVGFIGAAPVPVIQTFRAGFEAGVHWVAPETTVLATFVDQFGDVNGFARRDLGEERAASLYEQGADVLFAAAGFSGFGMFDAAVAESEAIGRHLWAIGVDNDQWFTVDERARPHVLTSVLKRGDTAAFLLVEHMVNDGPPGVAARLGVAEDGFDYSTQGDGLTEPIIARLNQAIADITEGRITVPTVPTGPSVDPGAYAVNALGTPFTVTIPPDWMVVQNMPGAAAFSRPESSRDGDREVWFFRPTLLADPRQPSAAVEDQVWWSLDDIEGWIDAMPAGVVGARPASTEIGGRPAVYFEAEVTNPDRCGSNHCIGFVINTWVAENTISAWSFEPGIHHRIWWVDGGDEAPLVIIAGTRADDRSFQPLADELLDSLVIGDPQPHPAPPDQGS